MYLARVLLHRQADEMVQAAIPVEVRAAPVVGPGAGDGGRETDVMISGMYLDTNGISHGAFECDWGPDRTFVCNNCGRTICYCGGHDLHDRFYGCVTYDCGLCDDCCTVDTITEAAGRPWYPTLGTGEGEVEP